MSKSTHFIPISKPFYSGVKNSSLGVAFNQATIPPLHSNVNTFENELEGYFDNESQVAALNSGTSAIHMALILLGVSKGDEVICQSMTFSASANPIIYQRATPVFVDSEEDTWNMCPVYLEKAIKDRITKGIKPKAIIAVHSYGMPYNADEICRIADHYGIPVVEDSAEALGSRYKERKCGNLGTISIFSFNNNKIVTAMGGGALIVQTAELKKNAIFLATQAKDQADHYQHSTLGYNYRMSELCARFGLGQLRMLENRVEEHRSMHAFYRDIFSEIQGVTVFSEPTETYFSNHWLVAILVDPNKTNGITKFHLQSAFAKAHIESRPIWKPMHLQPIFEKMPYYGADVSKNLFEKGLCLPSGINISHDERIRIESIIKCTFAK